MNENKAVEPIRKNEMERIPPLVSVLIPTYNRSELLIKTINSVLEQTYPNVQIIVVDDASTDNTRQVVQDHFADQVIYVRESVNSQGNKVYETGLKYTMGKYINFLDHDDLFLPQKLEQQVRFLENHPDYDLVNCGYHYIDQSGQVIETHCSHYNGFLLEELLINNLVWSGGPLIRRSILDKPGLFEDPFWMIGDWSRWIRLSMSGSRCGYIAEPLGSYRILQDSEMSNVSDLEEWVVDLLDRFFSDPVLQDYRRLAPEAFAREYLFLGCRYYAKGDRINGKRCFEKSISYRPEWQESDSSFRDTIIMDAAGVRVTDPMGFLSGLFDPIPTGMETLAADQEFVYGKVCLLSALRSINQDNPQSCREWIEKAIYYQPSIPDDGRSIASAITTYANILAFNDPITYINKAFSLLSKIIPSLPGYHSEVIGNILMDRITKDYLKGKRKGISWRILKVWRIHPPWLINRGALSMFFRTLLTNSDQTDRM